MRASFAAACLLVLVASAVPAQDTRAAFEVASIKPNNSNSGVSNGARLTGDRFTQIVARGQSMDQLAVRLSRSIGQTVVNKTGMSGIFDFKLEWTQDELFRAPGASASPAIFTALTEQLGLRLQADRAPVEMLVIDAIERPTAD
jgi:uncharacterized protein (TIGR03435 family)